MYCKTLRVSYTDIDESETSQKVLRIHMMSSPSVTAKIIADQPICPLSISDCIGPEWSDICVVWSATLLFIPPADLIYNL